MKVIYDKKYNACAVEFDEDDCLFTSIEEGKIFIHSSNGGKPEIVEEQLLFTLQDNNEKTNKTDNQTID